MLKSMLSRLWHNPATILTLVSATIVLGYVLLVGSPAPTPALEGRTVELQALIRERAAAQGIQLPVRLSRIEQPPNALLLAPAVGAMLAIGAALWGLYRPTHERIARLAILLGGISAAVYFIYTLLIQPNLSNFIANADLGFWVGLIGAILLLIQFAIPAREQNDESGYITVDATWISGRTSGRLTTVSFTQNLIVAFDALLANKLRALLTMLGVIIGVGMIVTLQAVGQGAQDAVTENIGNLGTNLVTVTPIGHPPTLVEDDADAILAGVPGVEAVLPEYGSNLTVSSRSESGTLRVVGVTSEYASWRNQDVQVGRFLNDADSDDSRRVAVVGTTVVEEYFSGANPVGETLTINDQRFEIIGVMEQQDVTFGQDPNARVYVPLPTAYRYLFNARAIASNDRLLTSLTVVVENTENIDTVMAGIQVVLRQQHQLDNNEENDFRINNQSQLLETLESTTETFTVLLAALASVSLVVGGIGIMNISLVSVTERTKEIGLRKAVGGRRYHILQQFIIETVVLSVVGGLFGVLSGVIIAHIVNSTDLLNTTVTWEAITIGLASAFVTGIFFGVYPASRAAALEPIEALRYE